MFRKTEYKLDKDYIPIGRKLLAIDDLDDAYNDETSSCEKEKNPTVYSGKEIADSRIFDFLIGAATDAKTQRVFTKGDLSIPVLKIAFTTLENNKFQAQKIIIHPRQYVDIRLFCRKAYKEAPKCDIVKTGLWGHLWTSEVYVSHRMPEGKVLFLAPAADVGILSLKDDVLVGISIMDIRSIMLIDFHDTLEEQKEKKKRKEDSDLLNEIFEESRTSEDAQDFIEWVQSMEDVRSLAK